MKGAMEPRAGIAKAEVFWAAFLVRENSGTGNPACDSTAAKIGDATSFSIRVDL
jgi:hypothetical protein